MLLLQELYPLLLSKGVAPPPNATHLSECRYNTSSLPDKWSLRSDLNMTCQLAKHQAKQKYHFNPLMMCGGKRLGFNTHVLHICVTGQPMSMF